MSTAPGLSQRERFRRFIAGESEERVIPFPIYKTAFVASALGREWATDVTYKECRDVLLRLGCVPSVTLGEKEWFPSGHPLSLNPRLLSEVDGQRDYRASVATPFGDMVVQLAECRRQSLTLVKGPAKEEGDFGKVIWYLQEVRKHTDAIREKLGTVRRAVGDDCLIVFFLPQPYELYCIFSREEAIYLEMDFPEILAELEEEIFTTVRALIQPAIESSADLLFFGSAGTELYSPAIFKTQLLPPSIGYAQAIREAGGVSSFHLCGRGREYVDLGAFQQIKADIVEGLGVAPTGNLPSLTHARNGIPPTTLLRGNLNLGVLRDSPPETIHRCAKAIMEEMAGQRFILSGECDILYGTPTANVRALAQACSEQ